MKLQKSRKTSTIGFFLVTVSEGIILTAMTAFMALNVIEVRPYTLLAYNASGEPIYTEILESFYPYYVRDEEITGGESIWIRPIDDSIDSPYQFEMLYLMDGRDLKDFFTLTYQQPAFRSRMEVRTVHYDEGAGYNVVGDGRLLSTTINVLRPYAYSQQMPFGIGFRSAFQIKITHGIPLVIVVGMLASGLTWYICMAYLIIDFFRRRRLQRVEQYMPEEACSSTSD